MIWPREAILVPGPSDPATHRSRPVAATAASTSLRAMRAACRKFLERVGVDGREVALYAHHRGRWAPWTFYAALGEMRGTFGVHLARIAGLFKLDVEDDLASILPAKDEESPMDGA